MLTRLIIVITLQYIQIPNHYTVTPETNIMLYVKKKKKKNPPSLPPLDAQEPMVIRSHLFSLTSVLVDTKVSLGGRGRCVC